MYLNNRPIFHGIAALFFITVHQHITPTYLTIFTSQKRLEASSKTLRAASSSIERRTWEIMEDKLRMRWWFQYERRTHMYFTTCEEDKRDSSAGRLPIIPMSRLTGYLGWETICPQKWSMVTWFTTTQKKPMQR